MDTTGNSGMSEKAVDRRHPVPVRRLLPLEAAGEEGAAPSVCPVSMRTPVERPGLPRPCPHFGGTRNQRAGQQARVPYSTGSQGTAVTNTTAWWFKQQKSSLSRFRRAEGQSHGVSRAVSPSEALAQVLFLASPSLWGLQAFPAGGGCIAPFSVPSPLLPPSPLPVSHKDIRPWIRAPPQ